jgi:hypothetical protein
MDFSAGKEGRMISGIHIEGLYGLDSTKKACGAGVCCCGRGIDIVESAVRW